MIEPAETNAVVTKLIDCLTEQYVFPEAAARICDSIRKQSEAGVYAQAETPEALCWMLTGQMQTVSSDKHLALVWRGEAPDTGAVPQAPDGQSLQDKAARAEAEQHDALFHNGGFGRAERLPGNVGYLEIRRFVLPTFAGETAAAAMAFLANTDALIIDVRNNMGGDGNMVNMLLTYFFEGKVRVGGVRRRHDPRPSEEWTMPYVPGKRYVGRPVYVLVNAHSYSAAELFAFDLQSLGRGKVVGEPTGGAVFQALFFPLGLGYEALVSVGYPVSADGKANCDNRGVTPDIPTTSEGALRAAHGAALEHILDRAARHDGQDAAEARATLAEIKQVERN